MVNLCNTNARDVINAIGLDLEPGVDPQYLYGQVSGRRLALLCKQAGVHNDPALEAVEQGNKGGVRIITCGRRAGYLEETIGRLAKLAALAGDIGFINWG